MNRVEGELEGCSLPAFKPSRRKELMALFDVLPDFDRVIDFINSESILQLLEVFGFGRYGESQRCVLEVLLSRRLITPPSTTSAILFCYKRFNLFPLTHTLSLNVVYIKSLIDSLSL